jgi:uncharacterized protein
MPTATGFQIVFLAFATQFFAMLAASWARKHFSLSREAFEFLGQVIFFLAVTLFMASAGRIRRFCAEELARRIPPNAYRELALVSVVNSTIPFAVIGAIVLWAFALGEPGRLPSQLRSIDPARAWEWTLSPPGLVRMVVFSWIVGPIIEELLFRGLMYRAWERQWGWVPSLLLTSAFFSLFHFLGTASSFAGSIVCICVLRRTGSIRASIFVHMAYNVLVSWPFLGQALSSASRSEPGRISAWTFPFACLVLAAIAVPVYLAISRTDARAVQTA